MGEEMMKDMTVEELEHGMKLVINSDCVDLILKLAITNCWNELLRRFKDMKCCGNCKLKHHKTKCPSYDYDFTTPVTSGGYCDHYKADGLTREERKVK